MAALKNKALKQKLTQEAEKNAMVTQGTKGEQKVLKKGVPNDHSRKHLDGKVPVVGMSIGSTLNMENYQSLRADVWLTDEVQEGETIEQAYERVAEIISNVLTEVVQSYQN